MALRSCLARSSWILFLRTGPSAPQFHRAGRWLDPEELTGPAVFLASEASNAVNGHILYVDGGILAYIGKQPK